MLRPLALLLALAAVLAGAETAQGRVYNGGPGLRRGHRIVVRTSSSDAVCGLSRTLGRLTGLFLQRVDGHWASGSCLQISARRMRRAGEGASAAATGCDEAAAGA